MYLDVPLSKVASEVPSTFRPKEDICHRTPAR